MKSNIFNHSFIFHIATKHLVCDKHYAVNSQVYWRKKSNFCPQITHEMRDKIRAIYIYSYNEIHSNLCSTHVLCNYEFCKGKFGFLFPS